MDELLRQSMVEQHITYDVDARNEHTAEESESDEGINSTVESPNAQR